MQPLLSISNPEIKETGDRLAQHVEDLHGDVKQVAQDLKNHISAHADFAMEKANDGYHQFRAVAQKNLFICVGASLAIGYLLASIRSRS